MDGHDRLAHFEHLTGDAYEMAALARITLKVATDDGRLLSGPAKRTRSEPEGTLTIGEHKLHQHDIRSITIFRP